MSIATAYQCPPPPCPPLRLSRIWHERRLRTASPICSALRQPRPGVGGGGAASRQAHQGVGAGRVTAIWKTWCGSRCRSPRRRRGERTRRRSQLPNAMERRRPGPAGLHQERGETGSHAGGAQEAVSNRPTFLPHRLAAGGDESYGEAMLGF
jgi:hypothetical protein